MALSLNDLNKLNSKGSPRQKKKKLRKSHRPWHGPESTAEQKSIDPKKVLKNVLSERQRKNQSSSSVSQIGDWLKSIEIKPQLKIPLPSFLSTKED